MDIVFCPSHRISTQLYRLRKLALAHPSVDRRSTKPDAVLDFPLGSQTVGRANIQKAYEMLIEKKIPFSREDPLPTVISGDLAMTSTRPADGAGARVQVARRQPDGSWLRVLDRPELVGG